MENQQFEPYEYVSAALLNQFSQAVSGNLNSLGVAAFGPGLLRPDLLTLASSGLSVTATMPAPFAAVFGSGTLCFANGQVAGQVSDAATVSFSGLVPVSGAPVTAYLVATSGSVLEGPYQVTGPQPGHPDYNPSFAAYSAYNQSWDTLVVLPTLTPPDGVNYLLLASTTLSSGQVSLGALVTSAQTLATPLPNQNSVQVTGSKALGPTDAGKLQVLVDPGYLTLPSAAPSRLYWFACQSSGCYLQTASSGQTIYGLGLPGNQLALSIGQAGVAAQFGSSWLVLATAQPASGIPTLWINEQESSGTPSADVPTTGQWNTRTLNTIVVNTIPGASLSGNQFTLPPGVYQIALDAPTTAFSPNVNTSGPAQSQSRLRNVTASQVVAYGQSIYINATNGYQTVNARLYGQFTLTSTATLEVDQWLSGAGVIRNQPTSASGAVEVYTNVLITKVG